jgi:glycosyltransferase involved in cell wall biosynthesis
MNRINQDPGLARAANYGEYYIDRLVEQEKPDALIMVEDIWAMQNWRNREWWNKFPCVVHTTLDSMPILPVAFEVAAKTPYFYSWADFATKAMKAQGAAHVKTLHGCVNSTVFRRLSDERRKEIRRQNNIPEDAYCFGMLSRNQLRKSFPNIIEAYALYKKKHPEQVTRLLFYTHYGEGWDIPARCKEFGVDENEVLCTYKCRASGDYLIMPYIGQDANNPRNGAQKSLVTANVSNGLTEEQVNDWYNVLDCYIHAFTSGGQERGIQEAKLAELVTLVTNYSCGEDCCVPEAYTLPLEFATYREDGTQFIKATTSPQSIVAQLEEFHSWTQEKRREWGAAARQWALDNYSIKVIGAKMEALLDSLPLSNYEYKKKTAKTQGNPHAKVENISDSKEWILSLYKNILGRDTADDDEGVKYWIGQLANNAPRQNIEDYFRQVSQDELNKSITLDSLLGPESPDERLLITMPESLGDCLYLTCLLKDARELYPDKKIYVATKPPFMDVFTHLVGRLIDYVIPYAPELDNAYHLEGSAGAKKYFDIVLLAHGMTQRLLNYAHNGNDRTKITCT